MIIVTANVGLLPFEVGKKRAYITDTRVGFFNAAGAQLNLRHIAATESVSLCVRMKS